MLYIIPYTGEVSNKDEKITCKNTMIFFATTGAVITAVAYITSFVTINTYNLSSELIMPNIGKSIYSIICGI